MMFQYKDKGIHYQTLPWGGFKVLQSMVNVKSGRNNDVKNFGLSNNYL